MVAVLSSTGVILAAAYMLLLYKNVFLGEISNNLERKIDDLKIRETFTFVMLSIVIFVIGIKPNIILDYTTSSLDRIIKLYPISIY